MRKTTCKNLRGACDAEIHGSTAEEMGENCKEHVMEMVESGDKEHMAAIEKMQKLSGDEQMQWFKNFEDNFDSLEEV